MGEVVSEHTQNISHTNNQINTNYVANFVKLNKNNRQLNEVYHCLIQMNLKNTPILYFKTSASQCPTKTLIHAKHCYFVNISRTVCQLYTTSMQRHYVVSPYHSIHITHTSYYSTMDIGMYSGMKVIFD
jgi:hypothetical protein